jgi:transcriptional regulator CtsR
MPDERRTVINSLIDLRNDSISQDKYTDIIDELLIKFAKTKIKNVKINEV